MVYDWLSSIAFFWPNEALIKKKIKVTEAKTELDRLTTPSNEGVGAAWSVDCGPDTFNAR